MNISIRATNCPRWITQILWRIGNCSNKHLPRCPLYTDETCCLEPGTYDLEWEEHKKSNAPRFGKVEEVELFFIIQGETYSQDDSDYSDNSEDENRYSVEVMIKGNS